MGRAVPAPFYIRGKLTLECRLPGISGNARTYKIGSPTCAGRTRLDGQMSRGR
jgi:hypothetical protein